jgi:hypothetical protein
MAHSILTYADKHVQLNDAHIAIVIYSVLSYCQSHPETELTGKLKDLPMIWSKSIDSSGPGCINLALDVLLSTKEAARDFLDLLSVSEERLLSFSDQEGRIDSEQAWAHIQRQSIHFDKWISRDSVSKGFVGLASLFAA